MTTLMRFLRNTIYILVFICINSASVLSQDLSLIFGNYSGAMGDTVCVDLTVENFEGVSSMEWRTRFDPSILRYISLDLTTSALNGGPDGNLLVLGDFNLVQGANGYITIAWANGPPEGVTMNDGDILYTICFEIIGDPCETSVLATNGNPNVITITIAEPATGSDIPLNKDELNLISGQVTVDADGLIISESHCGTDNGANAGSVTFAGSGGDGPFAWALTGNGVNESGTGLSGCETTTVNNLGTGTYTLTITDSNNNSTMETVTIVESSATPFVLTLNGTDPTCFDKENGTIIIENVLGGEGDFTYAWSNQNFVDDVIDDLLPGDYSLTITDENGCSTSASYTLVADTVAVEVTVISDPSCDGSADGVVTFIASGGTPYPNGGYDYDVDGTDTFYIGNGFQVVDSFTLSNMYEGCYEVVVIDDLNCQSDPVEFCLVAGSFSTLTIDANDVSCFGDCDGTVLISAASTGNFAFQVFDSSGVPLVGINGGTTFMATDVCPGIYMASISDIDGCLLDTTFTIGEPFLLELMVLDSMGPGCGGGDGMISFDPMGGTLPYSFIWDDAFDQPSRTNMPGGTYSVTVTDFNGCQDSITWTFADGGTIGLDASVLLAVTCESNADGSVIASVTVSGSFTFSWEDDDGLSLGDGAFITGLGGGIYHVIATDGMCTDTASVILAPGQTPSASVVMISPTCTNSTDGMLTATLSDGVAPAMFEWNIPPSTAIISNGPVVNGGVGVYNLHIIDNNGCESDELFEIMPPSNSILVTISNLTDNICFGSCTGEATFTASGGTQGTGDYTFFINGTAMPAVLGTVTANDLCAGTNYVLAIDGGPCSTDTIFFEVADATEIMIDTINSAINPPACDGGNDGTISVLITGGNSSNYDLLWINENIAGPDISNLVAGEYILQITDGNGCVVNDTINLITPDPLMVEVNPFTTVDISCFSGAMGRIGLITSGGNAGDLTFEWSPDVSTTSFATDLSPGFYSVTVTDVNDCTAETFYELTSAPPIVATIPVPEEPNCFGETTCVRVDTVTGGVGNNYTFTINNGPRLPIDSCFTIFAGPYLITVFDSAGCAIDTMITIEQPSQVTVDVGADITIDLGTSSDPVSAFIVSELDVDSITWTPSVDIECNTSDCQIVTFSPNETTSYTVTVTDENGCLATDDITVLVDLTRNVYTPNIFSPNANNQNDHFQINAGNGVTMVNYLKIFDRWGNLIYIDESYMPNDTQHIGWDGTRNGTENEPGVYVFIAEVEFIDGVSIIYKGDVTLVR
ncbi:MAG: gliding motility-associated-like protein [Saprospiraceae bacterium]|jgi:gliding motility-associated-like protein